MKTILLIDSDESVRNILPNHLEQSGYRVTISEDARKGIKLAKDRLPDLILCDVSLPDLDGYSVLTELNRCSETAAIPFIMMSAEKKELSDMRYAMSLGADDYMMKPFDSNELIKAISARFNKYDKIIKKEESKLKRSSTKPINKKRLTDEDHILLTVGSRPELIKIKDIAHITAVEEYSNVTLIHKKNLLVQRLLKEWERILPEKTFIRIHRSTIINLNYVSKMEKWFNHSFRLYLKDIPQAFVISRRYSTKIRSMLSCSRL